jgi:hypothetical protein
MMVGRHSCQSLRDQKIVGIAQFHLDDLPLFAKVVNRLNQQELDTAIGSQR